MTKAINCIYELKTVFPFSLSVSFSLKGLTEWSVDSTAGRLKVGKSTLAAVWRYQDDHGAYWLHIYFPLAEVRKNLKRNPRASVEGPLIHEIQHILQNTREIIGEKTLAYEWEAYFVEDIYHQVINIIKEQL